MMDAMSCGAVVLGSDTAPVRELIEHGRTGLLADFHSAEAIADATDAVLNDPSAYRPLGIAAAERIRTDYSLDVCLPKFESTIARLLASTPSGVPS